MNPDISPEAATLAAFEQRVLTRDEPRVPAPPPLDAASVQERLRRALRQRLGQRDPRRQRTLAIICHRFLAVPEQHSTDAWLVETLGLAPVSLTRSWRELRESGLVELVPAGRRRAYRLSRAGEDWLLAVVKGEAVG
jgi:DNA-binding transcriptional ArsR family regulator